MAYVSKLNQENVELSHFGSGSRSKKASDDESSKKNFKKRSRSRSPRNEGPARKKADLSDSDTESLPDVYVRPAENKVDFSDNEAVDRPVDVDNKHVNDFEVMMARKKDLMGYRRKKNNVDIINNNQELISLLVNKMRRAADKDRALNKEGKPAVTKVTLLKEVISQIRKTDLLEGFLDANILSTLTDWLAPMPNKALPSISIRAAIIDWLQELPALNSEILKTSGIGKAIMYIYRHPRETRYHKEECGRLISKWSRPIFNISDDFKTITKEERIERDYSMKERGALLTGT